MKHKTTVKSFIKCGINNVLYSNTDYTAVKKNEISDNNNSNYRCESCDKDFNEFYSHTALPLNKYVWIWPSNVYKVFLPLNFHSKILMCLTVWKTQQLLFYQIQPYTSISYFSSQSITLKWWSSNGIENRCLL